jgi:hypothetical protein
MKKLITSFLVTLLLINLGLTVAGIAQAATMNPRTDLDMINQGVFAPDPGGAAPAPGETNKTSTGLPNYEIQQHPDAPVDYQYKGTGIIGSTGFFLIDLVKYLMSAVAIVMIVVYAVRYIVQGDNEEEIKKVTKGLGVSIAGLIVIQLADVLVTDVFFGDQGEFLESKTTARAYAEQGTELIMSIVGAVRYMLGAVAVLIIIVNGLKLMTTGMEEENRKKALKNVGYAAGGLILVGISEFVVLGFVFREQGAEMLSIAAGRTLLVSLTNFVSGFVATGAFVMLIYSGYLYVVAGQDDQNREKVKKILLGAVIGLILSASAYAITNTLLVFEEDNEFIPTESDSGAL